MFLLDELQNITTGVINEPLKFLDYHLGKTIKAIRDMHGNAWVMIWTTFFWSIPGVLIGGYGTVYMKDLGVTPEEIGLVASLTMLVQMLTILLGGYLSDRFGRKKLLTVVDIVTWIPSMLLLIFAQNVWYFTIAVVVRNIGMIANPAWKCLCLEGVKPDQRGRVFSLMALVGGISGLVAPIAGPFIKWFGVVPSVRVFYGIMFFSVLGGIYARWKFLNDSPISESLKCEAGKEKGFNFKKYYVDVLKKILKDSALKWFMLLQVMFSFGFTMWNTFYPIFITDKKGLGLEASILAIIPFITSMVFLTSTTVSISTLKPKYYRKTMLIASLAPMLGALLFIISPSGTVIFVLICLIINNIWGSFWGPIAESYSMSVMDEKERARILSVYTTLQLIMIAPAPAIAGYLYAGNPRLLFTVILFIMIASYGVIYFRFRPNIKKLSN